MSHGGITGTELARYVDDALTVVVLGNLGQTIGATRVNAWGLAHGVAGRHLAGLHVGGETPRPDPDGDFTRRLRETLDSIGRGEASPLVNPRLAQSFSAQSRDTMRERLATLNSFTFVTCDDVRGRGLERFGVTVEKICPYRLVNAAETR